MSFRPNAPRMVTVLIALALLAVGIAGTLIDADTVRDLVTRLSLPNGVERDVLALVGDRTIAYACLFGSPMLLVIGSLLPGI
jgi:methylglyoxal synthase